MAAPTSSTIPTGSTLRACAAASGTTSSAQASSPTRCPTDGSPSPTRSRVRTPPRSAPSTARSTAAPRRRTPSCARSSAARASDGPTPCWTGTARNRTRPTTAAIRRPGCAPTTPSAAVCSGSRRHSASRRQLSEEELYRGCLEHPRRSPRWPPIQSFVPSDRRRQSYVGRGRGSGWRRPGGELVSVGDASVRREGDRCPPPWPRATAMAPWVPPMMLRVMFEPAPASCHAAASSSTYVGRGRGSE